MRLIIEIEVGQMPEAKIKAYKIVNQLNYKNDVISADFSSKVYNFSKTDKTKLVRLFLRDNFSDVSILETK